MLKRSGDVLARFLVRAREAEQSGALIAQLFAGVRTGSATPAPARTAVNQSYAGNDL